MKGPRGVCVNGAHTRLGEILELDMGREEDTCKYVFTIGEASIKWKVGGMSRDSELVT